MQLADTPSPRLSLRSAVVIVLFGATLLTVGLGGKTRVLTLHEVFFVQPAREMLASGDWVIPRIVGVPCTEKPPLAYWVIAATMALLGEDSELAARCCGVPAAIFTALLMASMATRWFGPRTGLAAGLIQLSTWYVLQGARLAECDTLLVAAVTSALYAFALAQVDSPHGRRTDRWLPWAFYLAAGLAFLAKGLIGPVIIFSACGLYLVLSWDVKGLRFFLNPLGLAIFAVCLLGWPIAAYAAHPSFLDDQIRQHFGRFRGDMNAHQKAEPLFFYLYSILLVMLPWTPFVVLAACQAVRRGFRVQGSGFSGQGSGARGQESRIQGDVSPLNPEPCTLNRSSRAWWRFALSWILPGLALLSASAWKHQHYSAPLLPPLSIMAALGFWQHLGRRLQGRGLRSVWLAAAAGGACTVGVAAVKVWQPRGVGPITMLIAILGMASLIIIFCQHRRWLTAQVTALFATVWLVAAGALTFVMPYHDSYRGHADFAATVGAKVPCGQPLHLFQLPDLQIAYYLRGPLLRADEQADMLAAFHSAEDELYVLAPRRAVEETLPAFGHVEVLETCPTLRRIMTERDRLTLVRLRQPIHAARGDKCTTRE